MKRSYFIFVIILKLSFNSILFSQELFHSDILAIKVKDEIDFNLEQREVENRVFITLTSVEEIDNLNQLYLCTEVEQKFPNIMDYKINNWYLFRFLDTINFEDKFNAYSSLNDYFEYVEKLTIPQTSLIPDDPLLDPINCKAYWDMLLPQAWDIETGNSEVTVAVIDNGLDWLHPDIDINNIFQNTNGGINGYGEDADLDGHTLEIINNEVVFDFDDVNGVDDDGNGKIDDFAGWNFLNGNNNIYPINQNYTHGTSIFGIIAAAGNNNEGAAGVAFNCRILHLTAGQNFSMGGDWIGAIVYAANMGVKAINMNFFDFYPSQYVQDIINYAYNVKNCILIAAAGFTYGYPINAFTYPASYENVIAASVLDVDGIHMRPNTYVNSKIDVLGSRSLRCPWFDGIQYSYASSIHSSGTAAMTTGLVALIASHYPNWSNEMIVNQILMTCESMDDLNLASTNNCNFNFSGLIGNGALNAYKALTFAGTIAENTVWSKTLKPHFTIVVEPNKSLTLLPNTTLLFNNNLQLIIRGELIVEGNLTINTNINVEIGGSVLIREGANITYLNGATILCNSGGNTCLKPNPPSNLNITNYLGSPRLDWNASPDNFVTNYDIYRGISQDGTTPPENYTRIGYTDENILEYIDNQIGIGHGLKFFYRVHARNHTIISSPSNIVSIEGSPIEKSKMTEIDTIYYLPDSTKFIPRYVVLDEIYQPHCKFEVNKNWVFYKVKEVHYLFSHHVIDDTLEKIGFYKDTLKTKLYEQFINEKLDSSDVYPFWYKVVVDSQMPVIQGEIELPYSIIGVADLCFPNNLNSYSGRSIGFHEMSQSWVQIPDFPVKIIVEHTVTSVDNGSKKLSNYILVQNYPNPFNPTTKIKFAIPNVETLRASSLRVTLKVFDVLGNEVATLVNEEKSPGVYEVEWFAAEMPSGIYFYKLSAGEFVETKKMILLR